MSESDLHLQLSGLRFPRHIFGPDGEWLCGIELPDDHRRLIENSEPSDLASLDEFVEDRTGNPVNYLCGNCLQSYLANYDDERLERLKEEGEQAIEEVIA